MFGSSLIPSIMDWKISSRLGRFLYSSFSFRAKIASGSERSIPSRSNAKDRRTLFLNLPNFSSSSSLIGLTGSFFSAFFPFSSFDFLNFFQNFQDFSVTSCSSSGSSGPMKLMVASLIRRLSLPSRLLKISFWSSFSSAKTCSLVFQVPLK